MILMSLIPAVPGKTRVEKSRMLLLVLAVAIKMMHVKKSLVLLPARLLLVMVLAMIIGHVLLPRVRLLLVMVLAMNMTCATIVRLDQLSPMVHVTI